MDSTPEFEMVTVPEAARRTGIGRRQFRRAIESGELPIYELGWPRVRWDEVRTWLDRRRRDGTVARDRPGSGGRGAVRG